MKSKFITGLLLGAAAGVVLGILFAPNKGSETRKKLAKKGGNLRDDIKDKLKDIRAEAEELIQKGKDSGEKIRSTIEELREETKRNLS